MSVPNVVRISYERHARTGLIAALSTDLPGLMAVGKTFDEVDAEIPILIADLVQKRYGVAVKVSHVDAIDDDDGFNPIANGSEYQLAA
jgi:hypothetical protein